MRVISLGSGSSGNALLVEAGPNGRTKLLVDAGFTARILHERLRLAGISLSQIQGVLITHEHADHILALPTLMKDYAIPVIADPRTLTAVRQFFTAGIVRTEFGTLIALKLEPGIDSVNKLLDETSTHLAVGSRLVIGDIEVASFAVSHDAVAPCGYLLSAGGCRVCVAIDSGEVTSTMLEAMKHADLLVLESNHDRERLLRGPYPYALKQRILSPTGHLSNDQAAEAVLRTWRTDSVRWLWLSHLSRTNNTPRLAMDSMRTRIQEARANLAQIHISVLPPDIGGMWDSTQLWHIPSLWDMPV
jgi:phosphoribosyl 1,2-cyclic phosphodiesterase